MNPDELFRKLADEGLVPSLTPLKIDIAFHGTDFDTAQKIVREQRFEHSPKSRRLGPGVYFYEDGPIPGLDAALDWGMYAPGRPPDTKPGVVGATLEIPSVFDTHNPSNFNYLNRLMNLLKAAAGEDFDDVAWEQFTAKFVGLYAPEKENIGAIRSHFALQRLFHPRSHRSVKDQKGLAIRKDEYIFNIRLIQ